MCLRCVLRVFMMCLLVCGHVCLANLVLGRRDLMPGLLAYDEAEDHRVSSEPYADSNRSTDCAHGAVNRYRATGKSIGVGHCHYDRCR